MNFPGKGLHQFLNIPVIYHHAKIQKKLMTCLQEKCQIDRQTTVILEDPLLDRGPQKQVKSKTKVSVFVLFKLC